MLEAGDFDRDASFVAGTGECPAGLVLVSAAASLARVEIVAVRHDLANTGHGGSLLSHSLQALRDRAVEVVRAEPVSSRESAWIGLLRSAGFAGHSLGSLRMRRRLVGELPTAPMPHGYELRPLKEGEEAEWVAVKNAAFPEDEPWSVERYAKDLGQAPCYELSRILVAERDGQLAGTTIAWEADYGQGPLGLIHWVGVRPEHRGSGLGKALNTAALRQLADRGYEEAWLNTSRQRRAAVQLYEGLGFEVYRELFRYELVLT
jgi:ribosomal-protein-alanine N-acetyltransferase